MALVKLSEYAAKHGKTPATIRSKVAAGQFQTATRKGNLWLVDEDEPYPEDSRVRSGMYVGWRDRLEENRKNRK